MVILSQPNTLHFLLLKKNSFCFHNSPPPQALLTILNQNASPVSFNGNTEEKMFNIFKRSPNGNKRQKNTKLMGMRNYCAAYYDPATGKMNFWIQVEERVGVKGTMGYQLDVPKLVFGPQGKLIHQLAKSAPVLPLSPAAARSSDMTDRPFSGPPPLPARASNDLPPLPPKDRPVPPPPMPPRPESNYPSPPGYPPTNSSSSSAGVGGFAFPQQTPTSTFGGGFIRPPSSSYWG